MNLVWIINARQPGWKVPDDELKSNLASARLRIARPLSELAARGIAGRMFAPDFSAPPAPEAIDADVAVFSKLSHSDSGEFGRRASHWLALARGLKGRGVRVVADVCDDHFADWRGEFLTALCRLADTVTTGTEALAQTVAEHTGKAAVVVPDPVEGERRPPRFAPGERLALLWFGHQSNLASLAQAVPDLLALARTRPVALTVVTAPGFGAETLCERISRERAPTLSACFVAWTLDTTFAALAACDAVILPAAIGDTAKHSRSANRLAESLWAGRFVAAHPVPSYEPFAPFAYVGDDLTAGLAAALADPAGTVARITAGQAFVAGHFAPQAIGDRWCAVLAAESAQPTAPLKLNLGCGDKLLPGYVNVDVAETRRGMRPDVLCDLHRLSPFADNSADEILSVHVVEHFWRWEVVDVLREWVRVLKPGGKLILECPNLISACREFLADPEQGGQPDKRGQRSMWVFYGDPAWRDPLMVHRWGYTPATLAQVMAEAGLTQLRQEPAQFKLREPRDMRVVGQKPR